MLNTAIPADRSGANLPGLLDGFTTEVTTRDTASIRDIADILRPGSQVFIASLPKEKPDRQVEAAARLADAGMVPVPHIVARNLADREALEDLLSALVRQAGVTKALVLAGDRDDPAGDYTAALDLLRTGAFQAHGIRSIRLSAYPEGHPRIADADLLKARADKLAAAAEAGLEVELVSQFCFEAAPILDYAEALRAAGVTAPFRIGVAGPADRKTLLKYALICGVGPSLRALKERGDLARSVMSGETPQGLLQDIADGLDARPGLGISGVHFFTFSSLRQTADWVASVS